MMRASSVRRRARAQIVSCGRLQDRGPRRRVRMRFFYEHDVHAIGMRRLQSTRASAGEEWPDEGAAGRPRRGNGCTRSSRLAPGRYLYIITATVYIYRPRHARPDSPANPDFEAHPARHHGNRPTAHAGGNPEGTPLQIRERRGAASTRLAPEWR